MTACQRCGRYFEPTVVLPNGARLQGHAPGGPLCTPRPTYKPSPRRIPNVPMLVRLPLEERAERVRLRLRDERRPVGQRMATIFDQVDGR